MTDQDEDLLGQATRLQAEANELLQAGGLLRRVEAFGEVRVGGSAALGLMMRREVDLYLKLDDEGDAARFFSVGADLVGAYAVVKASYSNHFTRGLPGFSAGLFWGIGLDYGGASLESRFVGRRPSAFRRTAGGF